MTKYIDIDLVKAAMRNRVDSYRGSGIISISVLKQHCEDFLSFLDTLQEQSCETCTNDKGCVTCKDGELWEGKEQPFEDLTAEIEMEWDSFNKHLAEYGKEPEEVVWLNWLSFVDIANYFYELGKNSK